MGLQLLSSMLDLCGSNLLQPAFGFPVTRHCYSKHQASRGSTSDIAQELLEYLRLSGR